MEVKKIYFDMDGVLADFDRGVRELCGVDCISQEQRAPGYDDTMWTAIREVGHFYDKLEFMPGAEELFHSVYRQFGSRCEILTGIPKPKRGITTAGADKVSWMRRKLSADVVVNIVYREQKPEFCTGKDCILIDDLKKNIEAWESFGGTGIYHTSAEETILKLRELGILEG